MPERTGWDWVALILVIIGAINWGLYAIDPRADIIGAIFMGYNAMSRIIYGIIGLAGLYIIYYVSKE